MREGGGRALDPETWVDFLTKTPCHRPGSWFYTLNTLACSLLCTRSPINSLIFQKRNSAKSVYAILESVYVRGGALARRARAEHTPGARRASFFDPPPTGDLLGGALSALRASATIWTSSRPRTPYFAILWALLLFDNGYFDASFTFGIWYIWILTQFHQFSSIFCSFPPHPLLTRLVSPHHRDPKKAGVM